MEGAEEGLYVGVLLGGVEVLFRGKNQDKGVLFIAAVEVQAQFVIV